MDEVQSLFIVHRNVAIGEFSFGEEKVCDTVNWGNLLFLHSTANNFQIIT